MPFDVLEQRRLVADRPVGHEHDLPDLARRSGIGERGGQRRLHLGAAGGGEPVDVGARLLDVSGIGRHAVREELLGDRVELDDVEPILRVQLIERDEQRHLRLLESTAPPSSRRYR